jgi:hypothetical protein
MEPIWEYQYEFRDGTFGLKATGFWMTDEEARRWHAHGKPETRRLDDSRRDRALQGPVPIRVSELSATAHEKDAPLPEYVAPGLPTLRIWWKHPEVARPADVKTLILEVITLRRLLRASVRCTDSDVHRDT